jgi:hypothetical protein
MRRKTHWQELLPAELRLLMSGLADWESRSVGPVRTRIRRKRLEAVAYYRKTHGPLANDRLWVPVKAPFKRRANDPLSTPHNPRREHEHGLLWHEA